MNTTVQNSTTKYVPNQQVEDLVQLVDFSRMNPDQLIWHANLNSWEKRFVPTILGYRRAIPGFQPTERQLEKITVIVEKISMEFH
jgi:hypothetical protein